MLEQPIRAYLIVWGLFALAFSVFVLIFTFYGRALSFEAEARTTLARGAEMLRNDRVAAARSEYLNFLRVDSTDLRVRSELVGVYLERGRTELAMAVATAGADAANRSERPHALLLVGEVQLAQNDPDKASATFGQVIEAVPDSGQARIRLAEIAARNSDFPAMVDHLSHAKDFDIGAATWAFRRARGEYRDRIGPLQRALRTQPRGEGFYELAEIYRRLGDWPSALEHFELAAQVDRGQADAVFWLGANAEAVGDYETAEGYYGEVLARDPKHPRARAGLERCVLGTNQDD